MISQHADDVIVLWITYSVNIDRQAVQRHCWLYVFIRCVGGCSPYLTQELLGVLIIAPGLRWVFWGLGGGVGVGRVWGGGVGGKFLVTENFFFAKTSSWGLKTQNKKKKIGGGGEAKNFFFPY